METTKENGTPKSSWLSPGLWLIGLLGGCLFLLICLLGSSLLIWTRLAGSAAEPAPTLSQAITPPPPADLPEQTAAPLPATPQTVLAAVTPGLADQLTPSIPPGCLDTPSLDNLTVLTPTLSSISFSTQTGPGGWPLSPTLQFTQTLTRVLATFGYNGLRNGLTWERIWYYGDQELLRGSGKWEAGPTGKLTVQAVTREGNFAPGRYRLELYVEGQLLTQGDFIIARPDAATQQPVKVVYTTWDGQKHQLNLFDLASTQTETLLDYAHTPAWSPDATGLLYVADPGPPEAAPGLAVFNMGQRQSYALNQAVAFPSLAWSPHRLFVATTITDTTPPRLRLWNLPQNLGYDGPPGQDPAWSPDGLRLAYRDCDRDGWHISTMTVISHTFDPASRQPLTTGDDSQPSWSWDGQRLAFVRREAGNLDIYTVQADGSNLTRLTEHPAADVSPAWTPDGGLLFRSLREGQWDIYLIDAECASRSGECGVEPQKLITTTTSSSWQPDRLAVSTDLLLTPPSPPKPPMPAGQGLLAVSNQRNNDEMTFTIDNVEHKIGPDQMRMLPLKPGHYTWTASWPGKNSRTGIADIAAGQVAYPVVER